MSPQRKWLILPPAVALLLILGPMSMQSAASAKPEPSPRSVSAAAAMAQQPEVATELRDPATTRPSLPKTPGLWQIGSTLIGVLILGAGGLYAMRRLRGAAPARGESLLRLRQSLRLSARQAVHAIEFEGNVLLIGESERGITMLQAGADNAHERDEEAIAQRSQLLDTVIEDEPEDGAVPRNLVIPRPATVRTTAPTPPQTKIERQARDNGPTTAGKAAKATATAARNVLNDFRSLLAKAGR